MGFLSLESLKTFTNKQISNLESLLPCLEFWEYQDHGPFIYLPIREGEGQTHGPSGNILSIYLGAQRMKQIALGIIIDLTQGLLEGIELAKAEGVAYSQRSPVWALGDSVVLWGLQAPGGRMVTYQ